MDVTLINYTPNPIETVFVAARTCYSADGPEVLWQKVCSSDGDIIPAMREQIYLLLDKVIASGHLSVLEHINFTFAVSGISRACSHQLVRHRIASFSQQSQRYVPAEKDDFVVPNTIRDNETAANIFAQFIDDVQKVYAELVELGIPREDARFVLPNATKTNIVMTMNFREIYQVCQIRLCTRAQWEIRELFWKVKAEIKEVPGMAGLSEYLMPKCKVLGYCPESKSCGMMPSKTERLSSDDEQM